MASTGTAHYLVTGDKRGPLALERMGNTRIVSARQFIDALGD